MEADRWWLVAGLRKNGALVCPSEMARCDAERLTSLFGFVDSIEAGLDVGIESKFMVEDVGL